VIGAAGRIAAIEASAGKECNQQHIIPGFIDLHVHGGDGADVMQGGTAGSRIARLHARHGTTSLLATTMTAPHAEISKALADLAPATKIRPVGGARILGIHLEGPYISPKKLGAQPANTCSGNWENLEHYCSKAPIRVVTLAPEVAGNQDLTRQLVDAGIRAQIGHSLATYEEGLTALQSGATSFTHLFNAMSGLHHRAPGLVGTALAHAEFAELIPDLLHVHPGAIRVALRAIPKLYCVTDATAATGMPDGSYLLGSQQVHKCLGGVRLADGTLAGSTLTMGQALLNLLSIGLDLADASSRLSRFPAEYLGLSDRGVLAVGAWADVVVLDEQHRVRNVYVEGEHITCL
jgi:N-acetylglucosamine-6-phosphate deacetylase